MKPGSWKAEKKGAGRVHAIQSDSFRARPRRRARSRKTEVREDATRYRFEDEDEHEYDDEGGLSDLCPLSSVL
jgi:hypothetical protein